MLDIPSHIGETVYPGIRLITLPESIPDSVLNIISNKLPNSLPNSVPAPVSSLNHIPNDIQVSLPEDLHVEAPKTVGSNQQAHNM